MTKLNFLLSLHRLLADFPQKDVEERLNFYSEMIEDRMEEGLSEEEAVAAVGSVDEIAAQIIAELSPASESEMPRKDDKRQGAWQIVLLVLGAPLWIPLLVSLWSAVISLWAVFSSLIGCAVSLTLGGIVLICTVSIPKGIALTACGLVSAGLSVFLFFGCKALTKGAAKLTKAFFTGIENLLKGKEKTA